MLPKLRHPDNLQTVMPGPRHSHVWVSLSSPLKEVPRPDILGESMGCEGIRALWNISASRTDKTKQVFFQAEEVSKFKAKLDRAPFARCLEAQPSWLPRSSNLLFPPRARLRPAHRSTAPSRSAF